MSIAQALNATKSPASAGKKYKAGKTPTHKLSVGKGADKDSRTYTDLAFLFPTPFGDDPAALGGAEMMPRTEEDGPIQKNSLVKYWVTKDKQGQLVVRKRTKASEDDERGVFSTVCTLKEIKHDKIAYVGEISPEETVFVSKWAPKA